MRFALGDTEVACTRTDVQHEDANCSFTVNVSIPPPLTLTPTVLAFGDSITEGFVATSFNVLTAVEPQSSYPTHVETMMRERYTDQPEVTVVNGGRGGERTDQGLDRFSSVFAAADPDLVLLLMGVNSVSTSLIIAEQTGNDPNLGAIAADLRSMARTAQVGGADVLLATLTQVGAAREASRPGFRATVEDLNGRIHELASSIGIGPAVDLYNLVGRRFISADGVHPTREGYIRIAEVFFGETIRRFETPPMLSMLRAPDVPEPADGRLYVIGR